MKRPLARDEQSAYARLIQLSDSALPIGTFSFSAALETAAAERLVVDADSLRLYVQAVVHQSLTADAVAAMAAFRAASEGDYEGVLYADHVVMMYRMGEESRRMLCRMGRRMAELGALLTGCEMVERWNSDIRSGATPGSHPVALALVAHAMGLSQRMLFASHIYGVASLPLNAALRCVKVSHYDTQLILHDVVAEAMSRYKDVASLSISDMNCFTPELDILASLHEVGSQRMFMN
jgi:urease accessory protein